MIVIEQHREAFRFVNLKEKESMATDTEVKLPSEDVVKETIFERLAILAEQMTLITSPNLRERTGYMYDAFISKSKRPLSAFKRSVARQSVEYLRAESDAIAEYMALTRLIITAAKKEAERKEN